MTERYLFIRLSALGDLVNTLPALAAVRAARPDAEIDWVVEDRFAALFAHVRGVRRVLAFPRRELRRAGVKGVRALLPYFAQLRAERYDAAVDFQGNLKGALHLAGCRANLKVGSDRGASREGAHRFAQVRVSAAGRHRVARALGLLAPLGIEPRAPRNPTPWNPLPPELRPPLAPDAAAAGRAAALLESLPGAAGGSELIVLHPGTSAFGAFKRYPPDRFGAVARALRAARDRRVVVTHGPGERELAEAAARASGGAAVALDTSADLGKLLGVLARASVVVAADSGPLLLASALGVPVVALFGPKDPEVYAPVFGPTRIVRHFVPCAPCSLRHCDDPICMTRLEPEAVVDATLELLARDSSAPAGAGRARP